jgi:CBS domain-containing protein
MMDKIDDVMSVGCECIDEDESTLIAARKMLHRGVGALPVRSGGDTLTGMLTDRDLVLEVVAAGKDPATTTAGEVATGKPVRVAIGQPVEHALELMRQHKIRRLPVVDDNGTIIGMVSLGDVATNLDRESSGALLQEISSRAPAPVGH